MIVKVEATMINGRIPELTIKFTERPQTLPEEGKKVMIEVKSENGFTVRAEVNRKSLKKIVNKMDMWNEWVASLSGKMKSMSADLPIVHTSGATAITNIDDYFKTMLLSSNLPSFKIKEFTPRVHA